MNEWERQRRLDSVEDLAGLGIPRALSAPFFYRFAWRLGWPVLPPFFQSFGAAFLTHWMAIGGFLLLMMEVLMLATLPFALGLPPLMLFTVVIPAACLIIGAFAALAGAAYYRSMKRDLTLLSWPSYRLRGQGDIFYQPAEYAGTPRAKRRKIANAFLVVSMVWALFTFGTWTYGVLTGRQISREAAMTETHLLQVKGRPSRYVQVSPGLHRWIKFQTRTTYVLVFLYLPIALWAGPFEYRPAGTDRGSRR